MRLIFLDTETPNLKNDRVCQIGVVVAENNRILLEKCWLVNPETRFDERTMQVHGISQHDVMSAPVFPEVWKEIVAWAINDCLWVMHNAKFDLTVIEKTLADYHIQMPRLRYVCTMRKARSTGQFSCAKLDVIIRELGLPQFKHHDALSDTQACRLVYQYLSQNPGWKDLDEKIYIPRIIDDSTEVCGAEFYHSLKELQGMIKGITSDGIIQDEEIEDLKNWIKENECQRGKLGFDACLTMLEKKLSSKRFDLETCDSIYKWLEDREEACHKDTYALDEWHGILRGIVSDGVIMRSELLFLIEWMEDHNWLNSKADELYEVCLKHLSMLSENEEILDAKSNEHIIRLINAELSEDNLNDIEIHLSGALCCLTGTFSSGCKDEIEDMINKAGGVCASNVTHATRYVFIGSEGSRAYGCGNHGTKVNKALEYKAKGQNIDIYEEKILMLALSNLSDKKRSGVPIVNVTETENTPERSAHRLKRVKREVLRDFDNDNMDDGAIHLKGAKCCLTGKFASGAKAEIERRITLAGGICVGSVNRETRYLFVGLDGSKSYSCGSYGSKEAKAIELKAKGQKIDIVDENTLLEALSKLEQ